MPTESADVVVLDSPFGVPWTQEPDTGLISRGVLSFMVDYVDTPTADYSEVSPIRTWSACVTGGPVAVGPTKEDAIHHAVYGG